MTSDEVLFIAEERERKLITEMRKRCKVGLKIQVDTWEREMKIWKRAKSDYQIMNSVKNSDVVDS